MVAAERERELHPVREQPLRGRHGHAPGRRDARGVRGALRELLRSADLSEALGEGSGDADVAGAIADCYADLGDFERAGEWYDRCIAAIQESEEGGKAPVALSSMWDC